jgi:hypothetical protein
MRSGVFFLWVFVWQSFAGAVEPTKSRFWTSKSGSKVVAKAVELAPNGMVKLVTDQGRELTLDILQLTEADQAFLSQHFRKAAAAPGQNEGVVEGPLKADADTSYFLYRPRNLNPDMKAPLMIWTQAEGGRRKTLEPFREAADLLGMIIATPVEARFEGGVTLLNNSAHTRDVLSKVKSDFRIQPAAVHFGGDKSGGAAAFHHASRWRSAGTYTVSGYIEPNMKPVQKGRHFLAGQTNSSSRYRTAWTAAKFGDQATHYLFEGTREMPRSSDVTIGMVWMYLPELYENPSSRSLEARQFEQRFLPWLRSLAKTSPGQAAFLTQMMVEDARLKGSFKNEIKGLQTSLARDAGAVAHVRGRHALDEFSEKEMARYGNHYAPLGNHLPKTYPRLTERLAAKYQQAEELQPIFKRLAQPTHQ